MLLLDNDFAPKLKELFFEDIAFLLKTHKRKIVCFIAIVTFSLLYFRRFLFELGLPTGADAIGAPMYLGVRSINNDWFSTWWPYHSLGHPEFSTSFLSLVHIGMIWILRDVAIVTKVLVFSYFLIGAFSAFLLSYRFTKNDYASFFSSLFYAFNPWILGEYMAGHYGICLGYSLFPLIFFFYDRAITKRSLGSIILSSVVTSLLITSAHQHFTFFLAMTVPPFILIHFLPLLSNLRLLVKPAIAIVTIFIFTIFLSANYILPYFSATEAIPLLRFYWPLEHAYFYSSKSILDSFTLQYDNNIYNTWLCPIFPSFIKWLFLIFFPLIAFSVVFFRRDKYTLYFTLVAIASIFLAKGPYPPFGEIFTFLYNNIPGFNTFRAPRRFIAVTCLSYSILIGIGVTAIRDESHPLRSLLSTCRRYSRIFNLAYVRAREITGKRNVRKFSEIGTLFLILALISLYSWYGAFVSPYRNFVLPDAYAAPYEWVSRQPGDYRIATLPFDVPDIFNEWVIRTRDFGYYSPAITGKGAVYYFPGDMGAFPPALDFLGFISQLVTDNRTDDILKILGPSASVRYVVSQCYAPVSQRDFFSRQDKGQVKYAYPKLGDGSEEATILENAYWKPCIYATSSYAIVIGGREALASLTDITGFHLGNFPVLYNEMIQPEASYLTLLNSSSIIVFSDTEFLDFAMQLISSENASLIRAAEFSSPYLEDPSAHWIGSYKLTRCEGSLVINRLTLSTSKNNSQIDIPFNVKSDGAYELWIRLVNRGSLSLGIDNRIILGNTQPSTGLLSPFIWLNVTIPHLDRGDHVVNLINEDGSADVDEIIIASPKVIKDTIGKAKRLLLDSPARLINIAEAENPHAGACTGNLTRLHVWNASNGYVLYFSTGKMEKSIFIPRAGKYILMIKSIDGPGYGNITIGIDDSNYHSIECNSSRTKFSQHQLGPFSLDAGYHKITVLGSHAYLDKLVVFSLYPSESHVSLSDVFLVKKTPLLSYMKIGLNKFLLHVKSDAPVFIVFTEAYNPLWKARVVSEKVESTITNSFSNGFYIVKVGEYDVTIEFEGQRISNISWAISIATLISLAVYFGIWHRKKIIKIAKIVK